MKARSRCCVAVLLWVLLETPALATFAAEPQAPPTAPPAIHYTVSLLDAKHSLLGVRVEVPPGAAERTLQLPVWNALYQVRDFAQYVRKITARSKSGEPLTVRKLDKSTWSVAGADNGAVVEYEIAAIVPGPYGAQFSPEHAFLNLAEVLLYAVDARASPVRVTFRGLPNNWRIATAARPVGLAAFEAANYDQLVDSPVEIGTFNEVMVQQGGARYRIVVDADRAEYDMKAIAEMVRKVVAAAVGWMGDRPFDEYTFIYHFPRGLAGGGMEHAFSTAIDLNADRLGREPLALATVTAHEFFHLWNVKRIRPQSLEPIDYTRENYTRALWFSEGVTSTVEDYLLLRAGLLTERQFLDRLARQIENLEIRPAHLTQSAEESSLDTWFDKYAQYRLPERSISYYNKGNIIGVLLDLKIREVTGGSKSLRDLFRWMNERYAKEAKFFADSEGVRAAAEAITGADFLQFFQAYVAGVEEIPYQEFFSQVGLRVVRREEPVTTAGFSAVRNFDSLPIVMTVAPGGEAERAGISPGDRVLSVDDHPLTGDLESLIESRQPGETVRVVVSGRRGTRELKLKLLAIEQDDYTLVDVDNLTPEQRARRTAWLASEPVQMPAPAEAAP